jgi:hypothetical protein
MIGGKYSTGNINYPIPTDHNTGCLMLLDVPQLMDQKNYVTAAEILLNYYSVVSHATLVSFKRNKKNIYVKWEHVKST